MKKVLLGLTVNTVAVVVLCLMMIATVGAGAATAKQDENPGQAGTSSIYFYDVTASDTHGKGKLMIDVDKHTFVFNGQGFDPSAQIALRARAEGSPDYVLFATGKATPSGNLHIAGTWEAAAAPADVVGATAYPTISALWLWNYGGFVVKIACYYSQDNGVTWLESGHSPGIEISSDSWAYLHNLGVPVNSLVKIHAVVVWGNDRTGSEVFEYVSDDPEKFAYYYIGGTTLNNWIEYHGIWTWSPN